MQGETHKSQGILSSQGGSSLQVPPPEPQRRHKPISRLALISQGSRGATLPGPLSLRGTCMGRMCLARCVSPRLVLAPDGGPARVGWRCQVSLSGSPRPGTSAQEAHRISLAALTPLLPTQQHSHQAVTSSGSCRGLGSKQVSSRATRGLKTAGRGPGCGLNIIPLPPVIFLIYNFTSLFWAVLGLRCYEGFSLIASSRGYPLGMGPGFSLWRLLFAGHGLWGAWAP